MNSQVQSRKRYFVEIAGAMLAFLLCVWARRWLNLSDPDIKMAVLLAPLLPLLSMGLAMLRYYRFADEYRRARLLQAAAAGAVAVGTAALCYPFLRNAGVIPVMQLFMAWPIMAVAWAIYTWGYLWRDAISDIGRKATLARIAVAAALMTIVTALYAGGAILLGGPHGWPLLIIVAAITLMGWQGYGIFARDAS